MRRPFLALFLALILAEVVFLVWPRIDLAVSAPFYDAASGTWMAAAPAINAVREAIWMVLRMVLVGCLILLVLSRLGGKPPAVPSRLWLFGVLAIAAGPGLMVNGVFKSYWGRARPRGVEEFGGAAEFTPAWQIADECERNCSFVSGEVAGATTVALILWLLLSPGLDSLRRRALAAVLIAAVALSFLLRIGAGGHFLSDSVFAALLSALLTLGLWHLLRCPSMVRRLTLAALLADIRAPFARLTRRAGTPPK